MAAPALPSPSSRPPLLWDIFCKVIDNFGDIGVCWRLSADLASRGQRVRLWVDDPSALAWMAPGAMEGRHAGVQVMPWTQSQDPGRLQGLPAADVWAEAFGCDIAPEFIANHVHATRASGRNGQQPVWLNLEYLSAQAYVERSHGLPSPVMHGPARGWTKSFFYPGFTLRTGGLLREPDLATRRAAFDRHGWLAGHGLAWQGERLISLFCYEPPVLGAWLAQLARQPEPTRLLVTHGRASIAVQAGFERQSRLQPLWNKRGMLSISYLPRLDQTDYDHLLWACDLNFVRGEDSLVRALWAGVPFVWHIYPQPDGAHGPKLAAFLDLLDAPTSVRDWHQVWNGLPGPPGLAPLPEPDLAGWTGSVQALRDRLQAQDDLVTALLRFVSKTR